MLDPTALERIGVYLDEQTGQYLRDKVRTRIEYDDDDPRAVARGNIVATEDTFIPHPVVLPLATDPRSVEDARVRAVQQGADFYHPTFGWLNGGRKPEKDHPENLGAGAVERKTRRTVVQKKQRAAATPEEESAPEAATKKGS